MIEMIVKYIKSVINIANQFAQSTRPHNIGQLSDIIQEYRKSTNTITIDGWRDFYNIVEGYNKIDIATEKTWQTIVVIKENLDQLTKEDVREWVDDLVITKTFSGLQRQHDILNMVAENDFRLATPDEESKGVDGFVDGEPISIKPESYKQTISKGKEMIQHRIVYYKETPRGLVVYG